MLPTLSFQSARTVRLKITYTEREVDVYDVFGVFEGVAEPDRRDDTAQGERQGETVLDEDKCARHRHRQHNHGLDDRLIVAALLLGGHVHPRRGQHQGQGPDHRKHRDDGERRGTQAPGTRAVRGLLDRLLLSYHAMDRRELLKAGEQIADLREHRHQQQRDEAEENVVRHEPHERRLPESLHSR